MNYRKSVDIYISFKVASNHTIFSSDVKNVSMSGRHLSNCDRNHPPPEQVRATTQFDSTKIYLKYGSNPFNKHGNSILVD